MLAFALVLRLRLFHSLSTCITSSSTIFGRRWFLKSKRLMSIYVSVCVWVRVCWALVSVPWNQVESCRITEGILDNCWILKRFSIYNSTWTNILRFTITVGFDVFLRYSKSIHNLQNIVEYICSFETLDIYIYVYICVCYKVVSETPSVPFRSESNARIWSVVGSGTGQMIIVHFIVLVYGISIGVAWL